MDVNWQINILFLLSLIGVAVSGETRLWANKELQDFPAGLVSSCLQCLIMFQVLAACPSCLSFSTGVSWNHLPIPIQILLLDSASRSTHIKTEGDYKDFSLIIQQRKHSFFIDWPCCLVQFGMLQQSTVTGDVNNECLFLTVLEPRRSKIKVWVKGCGYSLVVGCMLSMHEGLHLIPGIF